jgi:outer membrane protein assembly factor BamD
MPMISHDNARVSFLALTVLVAFGLAVAACGGKSGATSVEYSVSAQKNYDKGLDRLKDEDWVAAAKYFSFIKSRFPYSKYAVLAELRIADAEFGAEQYVEAIDSYKLFIKFHPTHEMVSNGYASFRIGEAYYKMLPGSFWLVPPAHEKDQSSTEDAETELRRFLVKYPDSPYRKRAKEIVDKVSRRLAAHEWYVANYYWGRDKPMGTVLRLRRLLDNYRGVGYDEDALWLLGKAYASVDMPDRARASWQELTDKYPKHHRAADARQAMGGLPAAKAAPAKPAETAPVPPPGVEPARRAEPTSEPAQPDPTTSPPPATNPDPLPPEPSTPGSLPPPN